MAEWMIRAVTVIGVSGSSLFAIAWAVSLGCALFWVWASRNRRSEKDLGPAVFSDDVHVKLRRRPDARYGFISTPSGLVRLTVHRDAIAVRCVGVPRWLGSVAGMNYTFDAATCAVAITRVGRRFGSPELGDEYVLLSTTDGRGFLEIGFKPRRATVQSLEQELIRAGARSADESAQSLIHPVG
jgi:hypothetical protein